MSSSIAAGFLSLLLLPVLPGRCAYIRLPPRETVYAPLPDPANPSAPQQVHISMAGMDTVRITWITDGDAPPVVDYGISPGGYTSSATGSTSSYGYVLYHSGQIHEAVVGPLEPDATYYYRLSSDPTREFSFKTPPAEPPVKFVVVGDLGQTGWTDSTLTHIKQYAHDMLLLPGDLSYADFYQPLWDSFGRLVEPLASSRPWMVTQGNHEIEKILLLEPHSFKAFNARWRMPYEASASNSNLFYSFDVAGVHVIMLGSYTDYAAGSDQYRWLVADLDKVNRRTTPWVITLIHAPWYNTNTAHRGDGEDMRRAMEEVLYRARVDIVFAGHVHAYERFDRVFDNRVDRCGAVHITIGDGGNREGLASRYKDPKPDMSLFREASFGHGRLEVVNGTHALWSWQRNDDDMSVISDRVWFVSLSSDAACL